MVEQATDVELAESMLSENLTRSHDDLVMFVRSLVIPSATGPKQFHSCIQPFQLEAFQALAPSLKAVRAGEMPAVRRFWIERTKKAGKDSDLAAALLWLVAFPERPLFCQVVASDQEQAGIIKRRMQDIIHYNKWLGELVTIKRSPSEIVDKKTNGNMATVKIEATDKLTGHGATPDVLVLNELVHVAKWEAMETHMNNAGGVPQGVVIISTNAGYKGTKAEVWKSNADDNPDRWGVYNWHEPASWIGQDDLLDAARMNTKSEFERLWKGKWVSGTGDALDESMIDRAFDPSLEPLVGPENGWLYVAGLDLGVSHDHSGLALIGVNRTTSEMRVAKLMSWEPSIDNGQGKKEVDIAKVERACVDVFKVFGVVWFGYDPAAGGSFLAQSLRRKALPMKEMTFSGQNLNLMAVTFKQVVEAGRLRCFEDARLRRDFGKFDLVAKQYGYRLEAVSDEYGHADVGTALVICLPRAVALLGNTSSLNPDDVIAGVADKDLTKEEIENLPPELRGIYESYDEFADEYKWDKVRGKRGRDYSKDLV